jgi:hypothetical protein
VKFTEIGDQGSLAGWQLALEAMEPGSAGLSGFADTTHVSSPGWLKHGQPPPQEAGRRWASEA